MKNALIAAALLSVLRAPAGAQPASSSPILYAFPKESDRFPYDRSGLRDGRVQASLSVGLDPWTNRVGASLQVCDSSVVSDMNPEPRCAYMPFDFYKQLAVDLARKTVTAGAETVATLLDEGSGPRLKWSAGFGVDYRIDADGNVEVFLARAAR